MTFSRVCNIASCIHTPLMQPVPAASSLASSPVTMHKHRACCQTVVVVYKIRQVCLALFANVLVTAICRRIVADLKYGMRDVGKVELQPGHILGVPSNHDCSVCAAGTSRPATRPSVGRMLRQHPFSVVWSAPAPARIRARTAMWYMLLHEHLKDRHRPFHGRRWTVVALSQRAASRCRSNRQYLSNTFRCT